MRARWLVWLGNIACRQLCPDGFNQMSVMSMRSMQRGGLRGDAAVEEAWLDEAQLEELEVPLNAQTFVDKEATK